MAATGRLSYLTGSIYDVLIIGAGINGCAAARQLTADGFGVLLVDRGDFGGVATAKSGRVLHCGLQLLQPRQSIFDYVRNPRDLGTRLRMTRRTVLDFIELCGVLQPQLKPLQTVVPIYQESAFSGWQVDLGALLIKLMAKASPRIRYRRLVANQAVSNPFVLALANRDKLKSVASFLDYRFHWPERIAIDAALAAEKGGAAIANFTEVVNLQRAPSGLWTAELINTEFGDERVNIQARLVLNLAGASVDEVDGRIRPAASISKKVTAIKGVYILVRLPQRFRGRGIAGTNSLGEPITCLPWDDLHYIGPTETFFEGRPEEARPDEGDIAFLLAELRRFMPGLVISPADIVMAWAGVRPITAEAGHPKGKRLPFNVLHDLAQEGIPNMLTLSWGIVVNHRSTARAISRAVSEKIRPSGKATNEVLPTAPRLDTQTSRLQSDYVTTVADVRYCVEHEHARDLTGVLFSRTGLGWTGRMTAKSVRSAALTLAPLLAWSEDRTEREIDAMLTRLCDDHRYNLR